MQTTEPNKQVDTVNITSFSFNSIRSVIIQKLKASSIQNSTNIPQKEDTGSYGNLMPYSIFKSLFPWTSKEHLEVSKTGVLYFKLTINQQFHN